MRWSRAGAKLGQHGDKVRRVVDTLRGFIEQVDQPTVPGVCIEMRLLLWLEKTK